MPFDLNKPAKDILLDLIFFTNGIRFNDDEVNFGPPQALDATPDNPGDPNTFIPIFVPDTVDERYEGNTGFMYRRIGLDEITPVGTAIVVPSFPVTTYQLLPVLNAYYGTQWTQDDLVNYTYLAAVNPMTITFQSGSMCYQGEGIAGPIGVDLSQMVNDTALSGFVEAN
jgi:hypothetical protein